MRIVILGSVALPVPPPMQGGTERIAYWQATELGKRKHNVTLIAAKGSKSDSMYSLVEIGGGDTVSGSVQSQTSTHEVFVEGSRNMRKELVYTAQVAQWLIDHKDSYDLILNNMRSGESVLLPIAKFLHKPFVTVMHLPIFFELATLFDAYKTSIVTISQAQRQDFPDLNYVGTVYNATDLIELPYVVTPFNYFLMMGSIAPHKNQKDGILAAKAMGTPIVLAGKIGNMDYWNNEIAPLVDGVTVIHKGEMGIEEKANLLGHARALLFPIRWPEPFGLVMIEAMATGTPVVAYKNGAIPEVVVDGQNGFIVDESSGVNGLVDAMKKIDTISRSACRAHVEEHFSIPKMIDSLEHALALVASV